MSYPRMDQLKFNNYQVLLNKHHLHKMDIYDDYCNDESDTYTSINRGEAREKSETKFENKKQRKVAIKEERKI